MSFMKLSLKRLITVPLILLVLASILLTGLFFIHKNRNRSESLSHSLQNEITSRIQLQTTEFLDSPNKICTLTEQLLTNQFLDSSNSGKLEEHFLLLLSHYPHVSSIYFGNSEGGLVDAGQDITGEYFVIRTENFAPGLFQKYRIDSLGNTTELLIEVANFDARTRLWFTSAVASPNRTVRSDPFVLFTDDDISISTSRAVTDSVGNIIGVVACDVFLRHLSGFLRSVDIGENGLSFVADRYGRVLASSIDSDNSENYGLLPPRDYNNPVIQDVGMHIDSIFGGLTWINSFEEFTINCNINHSFVQVLPFQDFTGKNYYIVTVIPIEDFSVFFNENKSDIFFLLLVSLLTALMIGILGAKLIAKPIHALRNSVNDMQILGSEKHPSHWMEEVNELSTVFSNLIRKLNNTMRDLKKSKESMSLALKGTRAGTWNWNVVTGGIVVNEMFSEQLGYTSEEIEPFTVDKWNNLMNKEDIDEVYRHIEEHFNGVTDIYEATFRLRHKNGNWVWILARGMVLERNKEDAPQRMSGTHLDITQRKHAEEEKQRLTEQIAKTRNLDSIGHLAGGVAHDLNNLLTPIIGYSELIQANSNDEQQNEYIGEVFRAALSAKQLVNQLLAFGRKQHLELSLIELNAIVSDFSLLLRRTIRENIKISYEYSKNELFIKGDVSQLEQVLMNLAVNAQDAMPSGGEMNVKVTKENSSYAVLELSDTGSGMTEETLNNIFEPFFSLKKEQGTGLGLATVYGIVKQHHGTIDVTSSIGIGTTFVIKIPLEEKVEKKKDFASNDESRRGNETILLVEDSNEVMAIAVLLLKSLGYSVLKASCGSDALEILRDNKNSIDLMLSDMIMPGISLEELYKGALTIQPELKVVFMSGYAGDTLDTNWLKGRTIPFISKPFSVENLSEKIRAALKRD